MNKSWIFCLTGNFCFVLRVHKEQIFLIFVLEVTKFGGNPWLPISSVKSAAVYGHWFGQLLWLCSGPAQSLGVFPSYLPVHSFQRTYEREVRDAPHSNLLWAGRMPERLTHSLIKVSGGKNDMRKVSYKTTNHFGGKISWLWSTDLTKHCDCICGSSVPTLS